MATVPGSARRPAIDQEVSRDLELLAELVERSSDKIALFIFGSVVLSAPHPHDLDVLAIYKHHGSLSVFRAEASKIAFSLPLHLIAMTPGEESHYRFIERTGAVRIADMFLGTTRQERAATISGRQRYQTQTVL